MGFLANHSTCQPLLPLHREVLTILANLGYHLPGSAPSAAPSKAEQAAYAEAKNEYRVREGRLFPTWSEVFELLTQLGYERTDHEDAA